MALEDVQLLPTALLHSLFAEVSYFLRVWSCRFYH